MQEMLVATLKNIQKFKLFQQRLRLVTENFNILEKTSNYPNQTLSNINRLTTASFHKGLVLVVKFKTIGFGARSIDLQNKLRLANLAPESK